MSTGCLDTQVFRIKLYLCMRKKEEAGFEKRVYFNLACSLVAI